MGTVVPLSPKVFETLLCLLQNHEGVLTKEALMASIWPDSIVEENKLTQNISALRRIFGETPGTHRYIVRVPGHGYRFVAAVKRSRCNRCSTARFDARPIASA
ncbi:MAG: winged helix-turn-helix domain-containing protein [Chthoniobacterales bacterium]